MECIQKKQDQEQKERETLSKEQEECQQKVFIKENLLIPSWSPSRKKRRRIKKNSLVVYVLQDHEELLEQRHGREEEDCVHD